MATVYFELELHSPDERSRSGGGWIAPTKWSKNQSGVTTLTAHCAGLSEIEAHLDLMQKDIEALRQKARHEFAQFRTMPTETLFE